MSSRHFRTAGCWADADRKETADHGCPDPEEHRLRGGARGAARRRAGPAHRLRPDAPDDRASGCPAPGAPRRDRAGRQLRGRPGRAGARDRSALGRPGRRPARDRLRARRRDRREFPGDAGRERAGGLPDERVLLPGAGAPSGAADGPGDQRRRPRLRRLRRLAGIRLDGRLEGGAGGGQPLPGPRPRPARNPREPDLRRPDRLAGCRRHPRLRRPLRQLAGGRAARLGLRRPDARRTRGLLPALGLVRGDQRRADSRRRRGPRGRGCCARAGVIERRRAAAGRVRDRQLSRASSGVRKPSARTSFPA